MTASIAEAVALHAKENPDRFCLADGKNEYTYRGFWGQICGYAQLLKRYGVEKGDHVVVRNSQNAATLIAGLAVQLLGAVFVPLEKEVADQRIQEIIETVNAKLYIANRKTEVPCAYAPITEALMNYKEDMGHLVSMTGNFPKKQETAEILFTTGTTGKSKGIELSHGSVVAVAENVIDGVEMKQENVELIPVPISHSHGLRRCYANLLNGSGIVLLGSVVFVKVVFQCIEKYHVTSMDLVPAALSTILQLSGDRLGDYRDQLDYVQLGSAPIPEQDKAQLCRLLPKTRLYNFYGSTESGCSCIIDFNQYPEKQNCIGRPTCNARFVFIGEDGEVIRATKENPGLLAWAGSMNMNGYYQEPELTASILHDGYIRTEDLAYPDEDGMICLLGRKGDVITSGGNKIAPGEVEDAACKMEGILECACVPAANLLLGQEPKLFVVMKEGAAFDAAAIIQFLRGQLEQYKVPKLVVQLDRLPRSSNGKILKRELKE